MTQIHMDWTMTTHKPFPQGLSTSPVPYSYNKIDRSALLDRMRQAFAQELGKSPQYKPRPGGTPDYLNVCGNTLAYTDNVVNGVTHRSYGLNYYPTVTLIDHYSSQYYGGFNRATSKYYLISIGLSPQQLTKPINEREMGAIIR